MTALEPFLFADLLGPAVWLGLLFLASLLHRHLYQRPEPALARVVIDGKLPRAIADPRSGAALACNRSVP